jgi:hypothetical protein
MSEFLQKLLSRAKEKADSLEVDPVDNLLSTDDLSTLDVEPPSNTEAPPYFEPPSNTEAPPYFEAHQTGKRSKQSREATKPTITVVPSPSNIESPPHFTPPSIIEAGGIKITSNYMRFDLDIFDAIKAMSESETRIYLDLLLRSYGQLPARNICNTTNPEIASRTGIRSSSSFSKAIRSLEQRGYIKRIFESHQKNQKSIFRVYLPCELPGYRSKTKIENMS